MPLALGTRIDTYVVEGVIGRGGMATVYRVRHVELQSTHALKVLDLTNPSIGERLLQEGRVQATLRHPNVVAVTDVVWHRDRPGLVMEHISGPTLHDLLQEQALDTRQVDALAGGILRGVRAAHDQGLVHRDLKPANVLLAPTDGALVPKVADFGLAKLLTDEGTPSVTRSGQMMGTPSYMAPEQVKSAKHVDHRADVWALGAILYEMVCGCRAFEGGDLLELYNRIAEGAYEPALSIVPDLPARMDRAIRGALTPSIDDRIADCQALLRVWTGVEDTPGPTPSRDREDPGLWSASLLERVQAVAAASGEALEEEALEDDARTAATGDVAAEVLAGTWTPDATAPAPPTAATLTPPVERETGRHRSALLLFGGAALGAGALLMALVGFTVLGRWVDTMVPEVPDEPPHEPAPRPTPPAPPPVPQPAPVLLPVPQPTAAPQPRPAPPPAPKTGTVVVRGDATRVVLVGADGTALPATAPVPVGSYGIEASFAGVPDLIPVGTVEVSSERSATIECSREAMWCTQR